MIQQLRNRNHSGMPSQFIPNRDLLDGTAYEQAKVRTLGIQNAARNAVKLDGITLQYSIKIEMHPAAKLLQLSSKYG